MEQNENTKSMLLFCRMASNKTLSRYNQIKSILELRFHNPEFDELRDEVCRCYVTGNNVACVTLTNHLLERYLKYFLIVHESGVKTMDQLNGLEQKFEAANNKYLDMDLAQTLIQFKSKGMISKEEWKKLEGVREKFRNGFGHGDSGKILGDASGGFTKASFSNPKDIETSQLKFANVPFITGMAIQNFAKGTCLLYVVEVENLIRKTINHTVTEVNQQKYPLVLLYDANNDPVSL